MRRTFLTSLAALMLVGGCQTSMPVGEETDEATPFIACPHVAGFIDWPMVNDDATARAIAVAVIARLARDASPSHHDFELIVEDHGAFWVAFQSIPSKLISVDETGDEVYLSTFGGGGVAMKIAKCDGALSQVHWQR